MLPSLFLVCLLTFVHYVAAQMRGPIIPLYAVAHGATATGVGLIVGAHMMMAAVGSIPFGRASDVWGQRPFLLGGIGVGAAMSALLPLAESVWALTVIHGLAGLAVAAFSPSALSLVGAAAPPGRTGRAFAWYATAHYGAIGIGPFVGGLVAEAWGYRPAFAGSAVGLALAFTVGLAILRRPPRRELSSRNVGWTAVTGNRAVWSGWVLATSGLLVQGVVFTFLPLLAHAHGQSPSAIGLVFLVLGLANTAVRIPAGWMIDRSGRCGLHAFAGMVVASAVTILIPHVRDPGALLALVGLFGAVSGVAFVAISVDLTNAAPPATRGLVMGGYSTALYLGLGLGSLALGPVITRDGYAIGFAVGGALGGLGTLLAAILRGMPRVKAIHSAAGRD
jgi:DHA1 family multidrug resistance protein-like MFS transporter